VECARCFRFNHDQLFVFFVRFVAKNQLLSNHEEIEGHEMRLAAISHRSDSVGFL